MSTIRRITSTDNLPVITAELQSDRWETLEHSATIASLTSFVSDPYNYLLLAYVDNQVAGMLTAHVLAKLDARQTEVMLYEIEVKAAFRQQGIGQQLIEQLFVLARELGSYEVWVLTEENNVAANKLYQSLSIKTSSLPQALYSYSL